MSSSDECAGHRFVLEVPDPATECPAAEFSLTATDLKLIDADPSDFARGEHYTLDANDLGLIASALALPLATTAVSGCIRPRHKNDDLPYKVHTGRELALMLAGTKPFAHFSDVYPNLPGVEVIPERLFNPYVDAGRFVKRDYVALRTESPPPNYPQLLGTRCVLYSTPHEEWRIDAFIELLAKGATYGWSEELERLEGRLLGYEDWQTEIHIQNLRNDPKVRAFRKWVK